MLFHRVLLDWYDQYGRHDLPWRHHITPYRVWISEIMLQQTQVISVIPYFRRWMQKFPNVLALANASLDDVLHLWSGLGYYARARNLHAAAQQIRDQYRGHFPNTVDALQSLPGIGLSTAGAIAAIVFGIRAPILDGNVKRVLARYHAVSADVRSSLAQKQLWQLAQEQLPPRRVDDYTQAIMDLGAMICTRTKPDCPHCPVKRTCRAWQTNTVMDYPVRAASSRQKPRRETQMLLLKYGSHILLEKRAIAGIWGGLWSFPECEVDIDVKRVCRTRYGVHHLDYKQLATIRHVFTHFELRITPIVIELSKDDFSHFSISDDSQIWYDVKQDRAVGLPAPVQRLLKELSQWHLAPSTASS